MDLWAKNDVERILASVERTLSSVRSAVPSLDPQTANAYHLGASDTLQAIAAAFGLQDPSPRPMRRMARRRQPVGIIDHQYLDAEPVTKGAEQ